jgi:hypothetical protein
MPTANGSNASDSGVREWLAFITVGLSILGIAIISGVAIILSTDTGRPDMARLVFSSILPLLGTWVGTVLAFYFARENLKAATDSTIRLSGRVQPATPVTDVMIPKAQIVSYDLAAGDDGTKLKLFDLLQKMTAAGKRRMPILTSTGAVAYIVHDSTITQFAVQLKKDPTNAADFTQTIADLVADPDLGKAITAIAVVGPDAVIADARASMRAVDGCNDVFVTSTGKLADPVVGWITNTDLASTS